ncbi:MAG: hypothetical protein J3R72DRAFT_493634 [Linnemannia gamsii]|nr:MAG: hypothetical protein J3R72DRAFT_493634 [Linnemannia gamsii]
MAEQTAVSTSSRANSVVVKVIQSILLLAILIVLILILNAIKSIKTYTTMMEHYVRHCLPSSKHTMTEPTKVSNVGRVISVGFKVLQLVLQIATLIVLVQIWDRINSVNAAAKHIIFLIAHA